MRGSALLSLPLQPLGRTKHTHSGPESLVGGKQGFFQRAVPTAGWYTGADPVRPVTCRPQPVSGPALCPDSRPDPH